MKFVKIQCMIIQRKNEKKLVGIESVSYTHLDVYKRQPYANHEFQLQIECPPTYPIEPPIIHFQPLSMPHCNVNFQTGAICLDILEKQHWTPAWNLMTTMKAIWILLKDPVPDSPLNVDIANILRVNDQSAYNGLLNYYLSASPSPSTTK